MKSVKQEMRLKDDEILATKSELETSHQQMAELIKKLKKMEKRREKDIQSAEELRIENERLRNMMREKSESQKEVDNILNEFRKIQNLLGLGPNATSQDIIDTMTDILSNLRFSHHHHRY